MILVENLHKFFGNQHILKDISFHIQHGEIVGFLGQNGAGKTTLMRILTTFLPSTSGKVEVAGFDANSHVMDVRRRIGYLPETPPLYPYMTVSEYLRFAAALKDVPQRQVQSHVSRVLEECDLADVKNKSIGILSKGFKQRVGIAQAIIHDPEVLILDEPTSGLDPVQNLHVRNLIKNLEQKRTVILSTHILPEIEQIAKRVMIIKEGRIIVDKPIDHLLSSPSDKREIFICAKGEAVFLKEAFRQAQIQIRRMDSAGNIHKLEAVCEGPAVSFQHLVEIVARAGGEVIEMKELKSNLENVFLKLVSIDEQNT